jgi:glycosyltransferase involved in cell wall biosynthesis
MKIAVVGPTYPFRGGIAHYTSLLAHHISERHETRVYGFHRLYPSWLFPGRNQYDPTPHPLVEVDVRRWLTPWWPFSWTRVRRDWSTWQPDTVVIQWWVPFMAPMTAWLAMQARRLNARVVMTCHNVLPHERRPLDEPLIRLALRRADRLIVHSQADREHARRLLPQVDAQVMPHPSYSDFQKEMWSRESARAALGIEGNVLLFFGLVRPYKGLLDLLNALPAVLEEIKVTLLVVGEIWGEADVYYKPAAELGLNSHVRFVDRYVSNDEAAMYFAAADLVVLPYREATGSGVLQLAFGLGVPVVATRIGGMAETVENGTTGLLVESGDVEGLSRAIVRFFVEDQAGKFREALRREPARFSWDQLVMAIVPPV